MLFRSQTRAGPRLRGWRRSSRQPWKAWAALSGASCLWRRAPLRRRSQCTSVHVLELEIGLARRARKGQVPRSLARTHHTQFCEFHVWVNCPVWTLTICVPIFKLYPHLEDHTNRDKHIKCMHFQDSSIQRPPSGPTATRHAVERAARLWWMVAAEGR